MQEGASGAVYGRNIVQHPKPILMARALMAIVHEGARPTDAMEILRAGARIFSGKRYNARDSCEVIR